MGSPPHCDPLSPLYPYRVPSVSPWGHAVFTIGAAPTVTPAPSMSPLGPYCAPLSHLCPYRVPSVLPWGHQVFTKGPPPAVTPCPLHVTAGSLLCPPVASMSL